MQFSYIKVFYIGDKVRTFLHVVKSLLSLSRDSDPPNYKKCFLAQFLEMSPSFRKFINRGVINTFPTLNL